MLTARQYEKPPAASTRMMLLAQRLNMKCPWHKQKIRTHPQQGRSSDFFVLVDDIGPDHRFCPVGQNRMDAASF